MKTKRPGTWFTDFRHFITEDGELFRRNGRVPPNIEFTATIVSYMSVMNAGEIIQTATPCHKRPNHSPCKEWIIALKRVEDSVIEWECPKCGYNGIVHGWQGTSWDYREKIHGAKIQ